MGFDLARQSSLRAAGLADARTRRALGRGAERQLPGWRAWHCMLAIKPLNAPFYSCWCVPQPETPVTRVPGWPILPLIATGGILCATFNTCMAQTSLLKYFWAMATSVTVPLPHIGSMHIPAHPQNAGTLIPHLSEMGF